MPQRQYPDFASLLHSALSPSVEALKQSSPIALGNYNQTSDQHHLADHIAAVRAASELIWLFVRKRDGIPHDDLVDIIFDLHDVIMVLPDTRHRNHIAKLCEWFWSTAHPRRESIVPQTLLFLLLRSFGVEGSIEGSISDQVATAKRTSQVDITRIYAMRDALHTLELSETAPDAETVRNLLLRCTTSPAYLRIDTGCKFLAHLLTVEDIRDAVFQSFLNQIASARKTRASYYGDVFLYAWKLQKSDWFFKCLTELVETAIYTASDLFGTNLRTVLSSFHKSKRVVGVDQLLHRLYSPVLYKNLMVANPIVRRNAVTILAESFPIHDPNSLVQDIEHTIAFQCSKLNDLLTDPAPVVRKATIEGTCRVLGLLWELVPLASAKKMLDMMTTKLAFDVSSARVRIAVFEGLKFIAHNHLTHQILSIALPRLGPLIHDNVEKVRFSFLDLLLTLKSKRIRSIRYFDVVPLDDLLTRLPIESPAAAAKIMTLLVSSYFPLERKGKSAEEIAASQVRACMTMLRSNKTACKFFYKNINLHVPPGPLCEFAMRLSSVALELSDASGGIEAVEYKTRPPRRKGSLSNRRSGLRNNDENIPPPNGNMSGNASASEKTAGERRLGYDRDTLLGIVSDVLASISPSLEKQSNRSLRRYIDDIFGGEALQSLLIEQGNSRSSRAVCWRIASCISTLHMQPIIGLWHEQMESVLDWCRTTDREIEEFETLLSALVTCGLRWKMVSSLCSIVSRWANVSSSGLNSAMVGTKFRKRSQSDIKRKGSRRESLIYVDSQAPWPESRLSALFALRCIALALLKDPEMSTELRAALLQASVSDSHSKSKSEDVMSLIRLLRKGCLGAIDNAIESYGHNNQNPRPQVFLDCLAVVWKLILGLLSAEQSSEALSTELRDLLEWTGSQELLVGACKINETFARSIGAMALRFSGDAVAVGCLKEGDMQVLDRIASNFKAAIDWSRLNVATGPAAELLRLSYQLREHYSFVADGTGGNQESFYPLLETSKSLLLKACDILVMSRAQDAPNNGVNTKTTLLDGFMCETLLAFCAGDDFSALCEDLGDRLRSCCSTANDGERNLFAIVICKVIRRLVISPPRGMGLSPFKFYESLICGICSKVDEQSSQRATMCLTWLLVRSVSEELEDSDKIPGNDVRQFLTSLEIFLKQRHKNEAEALNDREQSECHSEIRSVLDGLQTLCQLSRGGSQSLENAANVTVERATQMTHQGGESTLQAEAAEVTQGGTADSVWEEAADMKEEEAVHKTRREAKDGIREEEATKAVQGENSNGTQKESTETRHGETVDGYPSTSMLKERSAKRREVSNVRR